MKNKRTTIHPKNKIFFKNLGSIFFPQINFIFTSGTKRGTNFRSMAIINTYLAIQRNTEQPRTIQACFSSSLPHGENWTMDNYAVKFESSAHLNLDEINQRLNINYHQSDRKECFKFCIFLFVMLNTPSLSTALPTCNTDLPLTLFWTWNLQLVLEENLRKHHETNAVNNPTRADPPMPSLLLLLSISEAVVLQKAWKSHELTPFSPAAIHKEINTRSRQKAAAPHLSCR